MEDFKNTRKIFSRIGTAYAVFILCGIIMQMAVSALLSILNQLGVFDADLNMQLLLMMLPQYIIAAPICWLILKDMPKAGMESRSMTGKQLTAAFFMCITVMYLGNIAGQVLMWAVNSLLGRSMENPVSEMVMNMNTGTIFLVMVLIGPVVEELLYRKLLIDRTRQFGDKAAILASGVVFGLSHGNFYQFIYAFGLGVIFAYIYLNTGKLRYTVAFHMIINFMGSVAALHVGDNAFFLIAYVLFVLTGIVLGLVLFFIGRRFIQLKEAEPWMEGEGRGRDICLNFGMILFFLVSLGLFLASQFAG